MKFSSAAITRAFPLSCRRHESHSENELHSHEFYELVIVFDGKGRHMTEHGGVEIAAGDVFLIRGRMSHGYSRTDRLSLVNIFFEPRLLGLPMRYLDDLPGYHALFHVEPRMKRSKLEKSRLRLAPADLAAAAEMIALMERELSGKQPGYRFAACVRLMDLIAFLSRCYFKTRLSADHSLQHLSDVFSHIDLHFREPITVAGLAEIAGMSESTLNRYFHRIMGRSPLDHVIRVRIAHARELLLRPETRVTEAAYESGFNDSNYFSRQFRRVEGVSPREFKLRSKG